ncbi:MAG: hypothetical protein ABIL39_12245 [candidate division WOR-3 bacterium]
MDFSDSHFIISTIVKMIIYDPGCKKAFEENPEKYLKEIEEDK